MNDNNSHDKKVCFHVCLQGCNFEKIPVPEDIESAVIDLEEALYIQDGSLVIIHCKSINLDIIDIAYHTEACIYCEEFKINLDSMEIISYIQERTVPIFWVAEDLAIYIERYHKLKQIRTYNDLARFALNIDCTPHFYNVSILSNAIATKLGCDSDISKLITNAALMHDIGKAVLPHSFLNSPKWFNEVEKKFVSLHVQYGYNLLKKLTLLDDDFLVKVCHDVVLYHHERHDGSGYPMGRSGDTIPLSVRIVAVADVYDAIRSHRPYRSACDHGLAISFLTANKEKFAPEVVRVLEEIMRNGNNNLIYQQNLHKTEVDT